MKLSYSSLHNTWHNVGYFQPLNMSHLPKFVGNTEDLCLDFFFLFFPHRNTWKEARRFEEAVGLPDWDQLEIQNSWCIDWLIVLRTQSPWRETISLSLRWICGNCQRVEQTYFVTKKVDGLRQKVSILVWLEKLEADLGRWIINLWQMLKRHVWFTTVSGVRRKI